MRYLPNLAVACLLAWLPVIGSHAGGPGRTSGGDRSTGHGNRSGRSGHSHGSHSQHRSSSRSRSHSSGKRSASPHAKRGSHGRVKRNEEAKDQFQRTHSCPSTGKTDGACPGYVVDHVKALACGGADAPSKMQWQTIAAGKAKDKTERKGC